MAYLKYFKEVAQYESYISGSPILPNVSKINEDSSMRYNPYVAPVVTSVTVNSFSYSPATVDVTGGTATPSVSYIINYSDGTSKSTGGTVVYTKNSGVATMDINGVLTWTANTGTSELTTNVTVTVSKDDINDSVSINNKQEGKVHKLGDICYWDGSKLAYTPYTSWAEGMGTPLAVCVIPTSHNVYGNGNAGFMSIKGVTSAGTSANTEQSIIWGPKVETGLINYTKMPIWDNKIGGATSSNWYGYISSDRSDFTGDTNVIDTLTRYYSGSGMEITPYMTPSPYAGDGSFYSDYIRTIEGNNALSDFNGSGNTATLVGLGSAYSAANACHLYSTDGISAGTWYLPAIGELAYVIPRFTVINDALTTVGGVTLLTSNSPYWTSTQDGKTTACRVNSYLGSVSHTTKDYKYYVRPFVSLP